MKGIRTACHLAMTGQVVRFSGWETISLRKRRLNGGAAYSPDPPEIRLRIPLVNVRNVSLYVLSKSTGIWTGYSFPYGQVSSDIFSADFSTDYNSPVTMPGIRRVFLPCSHARKCVPLLRSLSERVC